MFFRDRRCIGVSIDGDRLSVATIEKSFVIDWPAGPVEIRAQLLKELWQKEALSRDGLVLTFPHSAAIVRMLLMPTGEKHEIGDMVRLQAARQLPLGLDEVTVDYQILGNSPEGHSRVALIIVRNEDVAELLAPFHAAGLYPSRLIVDSFLSLPFLLGPAKRTGWTLVCEARRQTAAIGLFKENDLHSARCVSSASFDHEIRQTMKRIPASAAAAEVPILKEVLGPEAVSWAALAAAGISPKDKALMNLLSRQDQKRGMRSHYRRRAALVAGAGVMMGCTLSGILASQFYAKRKTLHALIRSCSAEEPQIKELLEMESAILRTSGHMSRAGSFLPLLAELNRQLPPRVSLRSIDFENGRALSLEGTCLSLSEAVGLVERLQRSRLLAGAELRSSAVRRIGVTDLIEFSIVCHAKA